MSKQQATYSNCKDLFAALSSYLDAELPPGDCAEIEAHIADCPPCIEFVNSLKKTVKLCKDCSPSTELPPLPDEVRTRLLDAYHEAIQRK
jgi:RNA polymerase sigma-70 factor (ECF subfamily)